MKKGPRSRTATMSSVFGCKHDGEDADGLARVARVFAAPCQGAVVVVDLPENALAVVLERPEIPLPVWVVVRGESVKRLDLLADGGLIGGR